MTTTKPDTRLLLTLAALLGLTAFAWVLQQGAGPGPRSTGYLILALAFVKARLILAHFMEVKHAAWPVRLAFEAWVWSSAAMVLAVY